MLTALLTMRMVPAGALLADFSRQRLLIRLSPSMRAVQTVGQTIGFKTESYRSLSKTRMQDVFGIFFVKNGGVSKVTKVTVELHSGGDGF